MQTPPLAERALSLARELGLERACRHEDGELLHVLAGRGGIRRAAEIGTGCGTGTAWIAAALAPGTPLFTAETDSRRAAAAAKLFCDDADVHVLPGDWRAALPPESPFDFLFVDHASAKDDVEAVLPLLAPRATVVLDDFTDERREMWLGHPELLAVELQTSDTSAVIVAVRRG